MTVREQFRAIAAGEKLARLPYLFCHGPRASTFAAWRRQGLSAEQQHNWSRFLGVDGFVGFGKLSSQPMPAHEVVILREDRAANQREWIDEWGVRRVDAIEQPTEGFATRRYLEFPVKSLADFEAIRHRYDPSTPERLRPVPGENERATPNPDGYRVRESGTAWDEPEHLRRLNEGDLPTLLGIPGLYWTARDWAGFEGLSVLMYDDPACVDAMMEHWTNFIITLLDGPLDRAKIDLVILNEDMGYKHAAMLSPEMMRRYMLPRYQRLHAFFHSHGVDCVVMDTDGHNSQILDVFCPTGIDGTAPMEIAAHNDPGEYLARHPSLFIQGGWDKREMRFSKEQTRAEVALRYRQAREHGRYLPGPDHGIPPDVPLRNYLYAIELAKGFADGEDLDRYEPPGELEAQLGPIEELFDPLRAIDIVKMEVDEAG